MFGSDKRQSAALQEALRRLEELEQAHLELTRRYEEVVEQKGLAEQQMAKFRLDFLEAVRRASRLERKLAEREKQPSTPSALEEAATLSESGTLSDSESLSAEDRDTDLDPLRRP